MASNHWSRKCLSDSRTCHLQLWKIRCLSNAHAPRWSQQRCFNVQSLDEWQWLGPYTPCPSIPLASLWASSSPASQSSSLSSLRIWRRLRLSTDLLAERWTASSLPQGCVRMMHLYRSLSEFYLLTSLRCRLRRCFWGRFWHSRDLRSLGGDVWSLGSERCCLLRQAIDRLALTTDAISVLYDRKARLETTNYLPPWLI